MLAVPRVLTDTTTTSDTLGRRDRTVTDTTSVTDYVYSRIVPGIGGLPIGPEPPPWNPADGPPPPPGYYLGTHPAYLGLRDTRVFSSRAALSSGGLSIAAPPPLSAPMAGPLSAGPYAAAPLLEVSGASAVTMPDVRVITGENVHVGGARDDFDRDVGGIWRDDVQP